MQKHGECHARPVKPDSAPLPSSLSNSMHTEVKALLEQVLVFTVASPAPRTEPGAWQVLKDLLSEWCIHLKIHWSPSFSVVSTRSPARSSLDFHEREDTLPSVRSQPRPPCFLLPMCRDWTSFLQARTEGLLYTSLSLLFFLRTAGHLPLQCPSFLVICDILYVWFPNRIPFFKNSSSTHSV